ncbi:MAG: glycosyl transferase group 1 [Leptolyngbya foveolarum]|uniref:Glycosyl transferase group 1 n=1 Tax=Leptolyngbya foveolarum TaxID=47253 RepID=A0A2W4UNU0_9CYAN|nr:MAG: glycosyl transferase group 1 [Leptolyngbya foveolarum]
MRVYLVANALQQMGYEVTVVGPQFGEQLYPPPPQNLNVLAVPARRSLQYGADLGKLLSQINGDLIYAIKPRPTSFGTALLKRTLSKHPVIVDIDDWEMSWFEPYRPKYKQLVRDIFKPTGALHNPEHPLYLEWMENWVSKANSVSVATHFLQKRFGGHYLPNGKDTQIFDPAHYSPALSRQKYGLEGYKVLMFPGTARPHKGLEDVLTALDQLDWPDLRLVIVGGRKPDGYEDELFRQWSRWLIKLPRFPIDEMAEVVAAAHVVVVPQRDRATAQAQFPLKLTDGMAMAKPIIATRVGDIPEVLSGAGYLVEPESPMQIAEQIALIFKDLEAANRVGQRARDRCIEHYSTQAMVKRLAVMFGELGIHP